MVEKDFTDPSATELERGERLLADFNERHAKLMDLRNKLNDAQLETNAARDTNAVNHKNLTRLADSVNSELTSLFRS